MGNAGKGNILSRERMLPFPQEKGFSLPPAGSSKSCNAILFPIAPFAFVGGSNDFCASGMRVPARGIAACFYTTAPCCCAAVGGSAALRMRHTFCGCRSAHLVEVQPNHRLPPVATMRRAPAMPLFRTQSAAVLPSLAPHDSKARLRVVTRRRGSWRSHVHHTNTAQRVQSFKRPTANVGGSRGRAPRPSLGDLKGYSLREENTPFAPRPTAGGPPHTAPAALQNSRTSVRCEKRSILWTIQ